jgi:hypothetical protein
VNAVCAVCSVCVFFGFLCCVFCAVCCCVCCEYIFVRHVRVCAAISMCVRRAGNGTQTVVCHVHATPAEVCVLCVLCVLCAVCCVLYAVSCEL